MKNIIYSLKNSILVVFLLNAFFVQAQNCIDFENGNSSNWYGFGLTAQPHITEGSPINPKDSLGNTYLSFTDGSGGSVAVDNKDFAGNWLQKGQDGCICFDYKVKWLSSIGTMHTGPSVAIYQDIPSPTVTSQVDYTKLLYGYSPHATRIYAYFVANSSNPIQNNVWAHYCLPITKAIDTILPSNSYGHWKIRKGYGLTPLTGVAAVAAWNQLIVNVSGLLLDSDYNASPSEVVSFDNFCWTCTQNPPPKPQLCCDIKDLNVSLTPVKHINNNSFNLNINAGAVPIQEMEVSVMDYHMEYNTDLCQPKNLGIFGNITSPNANFSGLVLTDNGTQDLTWSLGTPSVLNGAVKINISKPNIVNLPCCNGKFYFCLKIRFKDVNCNVCEKIVCGVLNLKDIKLTQFPIPKDSLVGATNPNNLPNTPKDSLVSDLNIPTFHPVTNPKTGKTWMDRNLGASEVATSSTDAAAYGDLYQWGRLTDGHEKRTSSTTTTTSSTDVPGHSNFILSNHNWRSTQNNNLWQGVNGINNPCPNGYRLPTIAELNAERLSWPSNDAAGAFASPLKWTLSGIRYGSTGGVNFEGTSGYYYSSNSTNPNFGMSVLSIGSTFASTGIVWIRSTGICVRCIKN